MYAGSGGLSVIVYSRVRGNPLDRNNSVFGLVDAQNFVTRSWSTL